MMSMPKNKTMPMKWNIFFKYLNLFIMTKKQFWNHLSHNVIIESKYGMLIFTYQYTYCIAVLVIVTYFTNPYKKIKLI